jgi:glucose-6-phosphate dehydrogenase assembly protein OpcA
VIAGLSISSNLGRGVIKHTQRAAMAQHRLALVRVGIVSDSILIVSQKYPFTAPARQCVTRAERANSTCMRIYCHMEILLP